MNTFKPGDTVYSVNGDEMEYVAPTHDGHITRAIYEHEDREPTIGLPELHTRVFDKPPTARYAEDVSRAKIDLESARSELSKVQNELREAKAAREAALAVLGKHPDLSVVVDWIDGRLTHLATLDGYGRGIEIKTIKDAIAARDESDRRDGKVRLLSLYGGYSGTEKATHSYRDNLLWQLSAYSDGSGSSNTICILGTSIDDVKERLQKWLDVEFKRTAANSEHTLINYANSALRLGLTVPEIWKQKAAASRLQDMKARLENAERNLRSAQSSVAAYTQQIEVIRAEKAFEAAT